MSGELVDLFQDLPGGNLVGEEKDFLEEMIEIWTEKDPSFRATFEAAWQQRELLCALAKRREEVNPRASVAEKQQDNYH